MRSDFDPNCQTSFYSLWKKLLLFGMISNSITFWFKLSTTKYDILSWNDFERKHWLPEGWRTQKDSLREGTNWLGHTISIFHPSIYQNKALKQNDNNGLKFGLRFYCNDHSVMQASNIQGKSFAIYNSLLPEARKIWGRRSSWQIYVSFCSLKVLPQMHKRLRCQRKTLL